MSILKHHRNLVALLLIFSFLFLLEASYMPLGAEPAPVKTSGDEQTPGSIEQEGGSGLVLHKKSPIIPIIIGLVAIGAIAAVLILVVFKTYDIRGSWTLNYNFTGGHGIGAIAVTFAGNKKLGTFTDAQNDTGTYTVDGKKVNWTIVADDGGYPYINFNWAGEFSDKDTMSGTINWDGDLGTWTATRTAAATAPVAGQEKHWKK